MRCWRKSNFDFVEFHLSYQDLEVELDTVFTKDQDIDFTMFMHLNYFQVTTYLI